MGLQDIQTFVFVMLENRSFDHVVGYLSTPAANPPLPVQGLSDDPAWLAARANTQGGKVYPIHALGAEAQTMEDPPHDHASIALQIGKPSAPGKPPPLDGFVASYMTRQPPPADPGTVMGHYAADAVPVYDFFARNFSICDHWFAALPTGTQPNRLMAMSGSSPILDNASFGLPDQTLVYDWLTDHTVPWCAYQWGDFLPFFALMPGWLPEMATSLALSAAGGRGRFRRYGRFREHWVGDAPMPAVIFIEPEYTDGPHRQPNDDHPPTGIARGQALLAELYATLLANPERWRNTAMIVTYDEHGGFFDHVPPLPIRSIVAGLPIATTGLRVPAFIVSPHVAPGVPLTVPLDHTSFLQLLADRFSPGQSYSAAVAARQLHLGRLSTVFTQVPDAAVAAPAIPLAALAALAAANAGLPPSSGQADSPGADSTVHAFDRAAAKLASDHPELATGPGWTAMPGNG